MTVAPSPSFVKAIAANLAYWQAQTKALDEARILKLQPDYPNMFRAIKLGLNLPSMHQATAVLVIQCFPYVERGTQWQEWIPIITRLLNTPNQLDPVLRIKLLNLLGQLYRLNRQIESAFATHQRAKNIAQQNNNLFGIAEANYQLSINHRLARSYDEAQAFGEAALATFTQLDCPTKIAATLNTLGLIAQEQGAFKTAEQKLRDAITIGKPVITPTLLARTLHNLAITLQNQQEYEAAAKAYEEAQTLLASTTSELDKIRLQISLGAMYYDAGQLNLAEIAFRRVRAQLRHHPGQLYYQAMINQSLGNVLLKQGQLDESEQILRRSLALWRQVNDDVMQANTTGTLAAVLAAKGQKEIAHSLYGEAITIFTRFPQSAWAQKYRQEFIAERESLYNST